MTLSSILFNSLGLQAAATPLALPRHLLRVAHQRDMASSSSQRDFFLDSPNSNASIQLSSSLPSNLTYEYLWVILFQWDLNVEHPFDLYQIGTFSPLELKPEWINGDLEELSRMKKLTFTGLKGKSYSLFAKVEKCK